MLQGKRPNLDHCCYLGASNKLMGLGSTSRAPAPSIRLLQPVYLYKVKDSSFSTVPITATLCLRVINKLEADEQVFGEMDGC